jgi:DNA end-binding protein Ku
MDAHRPDPAASPIAWGMPATVVSFTREIFPNSGVRLMPLHSIGSGTISFGLVSIPIRLYTAAAGAGIAFNLLHAKCGNRIRMQQFCPVCHEVVDRSQLVKGYEFAKDQYVRFSEEELRSLEGEASKVIDLTEFVPLPKVDPIYFEKTYYLGPDKGGEKAYRLLADAMAKMDRVALGKFVMRGKESLVLIRPAQGGLMLHTMYFADEVRDFGEVDKGESAKVREGELDLATRLIDELSRDDFKPEQYQDDYRLRVQDVVNQKVEGKEITAVSPEVHRAEVIDLMEALKQSLGKGAAEVGPARIEKKPPVKVVKRPAADAKPERKAHAGRK